MTRPVPPDIAIYQRSPERYAHIADMVRLCCDISSRLECGPDGDSCDGGEPVHVCRRHERVEALAAKMLARGIRSVGPRRRLP